MAEIIQFIGYGIPAEQSAAEGAEPEYAIPINDEGLDVSACQGSKIPTLPGNRGDNPPTFNFPKALVGSCPDSAGGIFPEAQNRTQNTVAAIHGQDFEGCADGSSMKQGTRTPAVGCFTNANPKSALPVLEN